MSKKLPLHEIHRAAGASFIDLFDWQMVLKFAPDDSEYWALHRSAGLIDLSSSGIFELKGEDRARFLHGMVTNDIKALVPGRGCYAAFLSPQGRMTADLRVFCTEDSLILTTDPAGRQKLGPALRKYIIGDRPLLLDRSEELAVLSMQGPKTPEVLSGIFSQALPLELPYDHGEVSLAGGRTRICSVRRTNMGGVDFIVERQGLAALWNLILETRQQGAVQPVGFESFNVHRIEAGIPWLGLDMDENTLPIEAGLEKSAISFNKGCYIGQESVARITYRGHVNRKLVGLTLSGPASNGAKISKDRQEVGWVTSSAYSPSLRRAIALGYVRREVLDPGTVVLVGSGDREHATVTSLPFPETQPPAP